MARGQLEHLPDEPGRRPVCQAHHTTAAAHAQQFVRRPLVIGGEHYPDGRQHVVERCVWVGQLLGIGFPELHRQVLGTGPGARLLQQGGHVVDPGGRAKAAGSS